MKRTEMSRRDFLQLAAGSSAAVALAACAAPVPVSDGFRSNGRANYPEFLQSRRSVH